MLGVWLASGCLWNGRRPFPCCTLRGVSYTCFITAPHQNLSTFAANDGVCLLHHMLTSGGCRSLLEGDVTDDHKKGAAHNLAGMLSKVSASPVTRAICTKIVSAPMALRRPVLLVWIAWCSVSNKMLGSQKRLSSQCEERLMPINFQFESGSSYDCSMPESQGHIAPGLHNDVGPINAATVR